MEKFMNKKIMEKTEELVSTLEQSSLYQNYRMLKEKLEKNETVKKLVNEIKKKQKQLVRLTYEKQDTQYLEQELSNLESELKQIPLYSEFMETQEQLNDILYEIKTQIEQCFDLNIK